MATQEWNNWPQGEIVRDETPIGYYRTGDPAKPSVVLLHGFTDFGLCWAPVAIDLAADYDVVMIDAIGHGRSGGTERGFRKRAVADVLAVIDGLGLRRPALLGHSMGAGTAAEVAATAPDQIRAVLLEDPGWRAVPAPDPAPGDPHAPADSRAPLGTPAWLAWAREFKALSPEERYAQTAQNHPAWPEIERLPWADSKALLNLSVFDEPRSVGTTPWRDYVGKITCPVLLLTADPTRGAIVTPQTAEEVMALWSPQSRHINLPGAGHNIRREAYAPFIAAVRDFLRETV